MEHLFAFAISPAVEALISEHENHHCGTFNIPHDLVVASDETPLQQSAGFTLIRTCASAHSLLDFDSAHLEYLSQIQWQWLWPWRHGQTRITSALVQWHCHSHATALPKGCSARAWDLQLQIFDPTSWLQKHEQDQLQRCGHLLQTAKAKCTLEEDREIIENQAGVCAVSS